jgi:hypothetical protein
MKYEENLLIILMCISSFIVFILLTSCITLESKNCEDTMSCSSSWRH